MLWRSCDKGNLSLDWRTFHPVSKIPATTYGRMYESCKISAFQVWQSLNGMKLFPTPCNSVDRDVEHSKHRIRPQSQNWHIVTFWGEEHMKCKSYFLHKSKWPTLHGPFYATWPVGKLRSFMHERYVALFHCYFYKFDNFLCHLFCGF